MKWTNPERLDAYGVRLVGWPDGVPAQNPSTLKVNQNKVLLEAIQNGSMKFVKVIPDPSGSRDTPSGGDDDANEDFSWAYDADALPALPSPAPTMASSSAFTRAPTVTPLSSTTIDDNDPWSMQPTMTAEPDQAHSSYDVNYAWEGEFNEEAINTLGEEWDLERPRKRQRSEEPFSGFTE